MSPIKMSPKWMTKSPFFRGTEIDFVKSGKWLDVIILHFMYS